MSDEEFLNSTMKKILLLVDYILEKNKQAEKNIKKQATTKKPSNVKPVENIRAFAQSLGGIKNG